VQARLYVISASHPSRAAALMLEHKGIDFERVKVVPGGQALLRLAGFRGGTVPALKLGDRRVTGTRRISRLLDEVRPEPALFPADGARRRAVEEAEAWGDEVLQPIPRRLLRWALHHDAGTRMHFARLLGLRPAALHARVTIRLVGAFYARREEARSAERVRADRAALPGHLDHVEALLADGVIGGPQPNAADFQIGATLRAMLAFEDFAPLVAGRPAEALARGVLPDFPYRVPALMPLVR
jgi:glutathione S-transferase